MQTQTLKNWRKCNSLWGEAGHRISKLCIGQATKNVLMHRFAEPAGAAWKGGVTNEWNMGVKHIEICVNSEIYKLKHLKIGKNSLVFWNQDKKVCKVRQVMSSCLTISHTLYLPYLPSTWGVLVLYVLLWFRWWRSIPLACFLGMVWF